MTGDPQHASKAVRRRLSNWRKRASMWRLLVDFLIAALVLAILVLVADLWWPALTVRVAWVAGLLLLALVLARLLIRPLPIAELDSKLGLQDRLHTFVQSRSGDQPGDSWLAVDLHTTLEAIPDSRVADRFWVRRRRALRWLVPLLILALLLGPLSTLLPFGVRPGGPGRVGTGQGKEADKQQASAKGDAQKPRPGKQEEQAKRRKPQPDQPKQQPPKPEQGPRGAEVEAKPLLQGTKTHDEFLVPAFVGEGPSRTREAWVAFLQQQELEADSSATESTTPADPVEKKRLFQRATERALQSRHVSQAERPFVRRYFQELERILLEAR